MKRILIIIVIFFSFISFAGNGLEGFKQYTFREIDMNKDKLKPYDIVVFGKNGTIASSQGHVLVVNKDKKFVEIQGNGVGFSDAPIYAYFHMETRKVTVLRYKNMTPELIEALDKELEKHYNKNYSIFVSSDPENLYTYCSKFICNIYHDAGKKVGQEIDIVDPNIWPIYPFAFLDRTDIFENVIF